jgi:hypothetical protein
MLVKKMKKERVEALSNLPLEKEELTDSTL